MASDLGLAAPEVHAKAEEVLAFWFEGLMPEQWFAKSDGLDREIDERFGALRNAVLENGAAEWRDDPLALLAAVILLDQFSRNIHRGTAEAFAAESIAAFKEWLIESGDHDACGFTRGTVEAVFDGCGNALRAYRERLPKLVELARALVIAELEIDGQYSPERHDAVFEAYGAAGLDAAELAVFPDYLVCIADGELDAQENTRLMEILSSGLPIKVLLQVDDLTDSTSEPGMQAPGMRSRQLASLAMGLNEVYVLQSSASNLFQFRERLHKGVTYRGPALFSVYTGANAKAAGLPPYLMAAAAMESRAFPAFTYDPSAGANWAARFCLQANSQVDLDWPVKGFAYEDEQHQGVVQDLAFTVVDFLAADSRYAGQLARVPREKWNGSMIAVDETLAKERKGLPDKVPSVLMVDGQNRLQKVLVTQSLIRQASRCREMWHSLQELGGIHNSHAEQLLAREQKAWEERMRKEAEVAAPLETGDACRSPGEQAGKKVRVRYTVPINFVIKNG